MADEPAELALTEVEEKSKEEEDEGSEVRDEKDEAKPKFQSPADPRHLEALSNRYPACCRIEAAEHRAISFAQLQDVVNYSLTSSTCWDLDTPHGPWALTHYDIMKWLVTPSTQAHQCSFTELVAAGAQSAEVYVSHCFGQPARDMLECLQQQSRTRLLGDAFFWIWAYAHQHGQSFVPESLHDSDAFQAMKASQWVLLPLGMSSLFSRTWCLIEVTLAVVELQKPLDMVAFALEGPVVLTQSLTEVECRMESKRQGTGFREKNRREETFPADVLTAALDIAIERSDAVSKMDRNRLLHKLLEEQGVDLAAVALNRYFERVNVKLRGLFASMMWLPMVESEKLPRNALAECVKANVSNDSLIVNLCASKVDDAHLSLLAGSMHNHLSRVDLNFCMCSKLTGKGVEDLCRHMPQKLKTLKLNFKLCSGVGQGGIDALASFPVSLTSLHLNFSCNSEIRSLASICQSIRGLAQSSLKLLDLDVSAVEKINDKSLILLAETLELSRLRNIFLSFRSCRALSDVGVEAVAGALPPSVTLLKLDFADCDISDVSLDALSSQLSHFQEIGVIQVNLQGCQVTETSVARFVSKLPRSLRGAKLNLSGTPLPQEIQKICRRLPTMRSWVPSKPSANAFSSTQTCNNSAQEQRSGLALESIDLFLHRGQVQSVSLPAVKAIRGHKLSWLETMYPSATDEEMKRLSRAFSEPHVRQFKALLPKVASLTRGGSSVNSARPECMYSRPRTSYNGFSEPIWYP